MSTVQILGAPFSTFVRVVRIVAEEKGVAYELVPLGPHTPEVDAIHPFGRIPVLRHGDVTLCESRAIACYLDQRFEGPSLIPSSPTEQAHVEQWVSLILTGFDPVLVRSYLLAYVFPGTENGQPDRGRIDSVLPEVELCLDLLTRAVEPTGHLVGTAFTLADAYLIPILAYLKDLPESGKRIADSPALRDYVSQHEARASVRATVPPPLPGG
jgi:glutathione S-transferase